MRTANNTFWHWKCSTQKTSLCLLALNIYAELIYSHHVTDFRRRDAEVSERDGDDEDEGTDDRRQRVDVDEEHEALVEGSLHLKKDLAH